MSASLERQGPGAQRIERFSLALCDGGGPQYGAGAVGEEHSYISVAAFADAPEVPMGSGGILFRGEPEPRSEGSAAAKLVHLSGGLGRQGGGGNEPNAGYGLQLLQQPHFVQFGLQHRAQQRGYGGIVIT